jgi:hypothetical protein
MAWQVATQSPVEILIQEQTHSGGGERVLARFFQQRNDLFALYAGKAFQKLFDRIAGFQMIEKTFHRYARPDENRLAAENVWILRHDLAHK